MKKNSKYAWLLSLLALFLFAAGCQQTTEESSNDDPRNAVHQEEQEENVPTLIALPTGQERTKTLQELSEEGRKAYNDQIYALLDECSAQQISDGLKKELEAWNAKTEGVAFTDVSIEVNQDPLLMWSNGDKRQYRNITADIRLFYDPASVEGRQMEPLLEEAQQVIRQSPYSLKLLSVALAFVDKATSYPNYAVDNVGMGLTGEEDPSAPIPSEEQTLQTLAYDKVSAFNQQEFSGEQFASLPYANMTLSRFGTTQGSPVLECEVRIQESSGGDAQAFEQKLQVLAQELADSWMEEGTALGALGISSARITFLLRYSSDASLIYELPLGS